MLSASKPLDHEEGDVKKLKCSLQRYAIGAVCFFLGLFVLSMFGTYEQRQEAADALVTFGKEAVVVGMHEHGYLVVENAKGERMRVRMNEQPAVIGDRWTLEASGVYIALDALVSKAPIPHQKD